MSIADELADDPACCLLASLALLRLTPCCPAGLAVFFLFFEETSSKFSSAPAKNPKAPPGRVCVWWLVAVGIDHTYTPHVIYMPVLSTESYQNSDYASNMTTLYLYDSSGVSKSQDHVCGVRSTICINHLLLYQLITVFIIMISMVLSCTVSL